MRRALAVAATALGVALALGRASAETRPRYRGAVAGAVLGAPASLDPVAARSHAEISLAGLLFDGLYRLDAQGAVVPQLAVALPELDAARGVTVIRLRSATFHDGAPITAAAVVASLTRLQKSAVGWILSGVTELRAVDGGVELVGAVDVVALARSLALPQAGIAPEGAVRGELVIGSGPFSLVAVRRRERLLRLAAFPDYHAGRPYVDEVTLAWFDTPEGEARRFELGAAQVSLRGVSAFAGGVPKYRAETIEGPPAVLVYVGFGGAHPELLAKREVRVALDLALARGAFAAVGTGEQVIPTRSPVPPAAGGPALPASARGGDVPGALAAIRAAAIAPATLAAARLEILFDDSRPDDREVAERVARALDKIGVVASIAALPAPELRERVERSACDLWTGQLAAPITDAAAWRELALSVGPRRSKRAARGKGPDAARRFASEMPILPLYFRGLRASVRSDVRGAAFDPSGVLGYADLFLFGEPERSRPGAP